MAIVAISALASSTTIATTDVLPAVVAGITKKITAGNLRTQMFAFGTADPINTGILTAVGNSTITGTLGGITTLTATAGVLGTLALSSFFSSDLVFPDNTYDIGKSGLNRPRNGFFAGTLSAIGTISATSSISVAHNDQSLSRMTIRNTTANQTWALVAGEDGVANTDFQIKEMIGGVSCLRILSGGNVNIPTGKLTFTAAASKIVPGATSFGVRNNGDSADNLLITDAGRVSTRGGVPGAAAPVGSVTIPIGTSLRSTDNAGTNSIHLIGSVGGVDQVSISADGKDVLWGVALVNLGGGAAPTLGTIGGSGPTAAAQNKWLRMLDSGGAAMWIPIWK